MNSRTLWIALSVGSAAGIIAALAYTPENRARLRKGLQAIQEEAGEYIHDASDFVQDQAERLAREAQTSYSSGSANATSAFGSIADAVTSVVDASGDPTAKTAVKLVNKVRSMV